jgi:uncharacterized protein with PIN domain
LNIYLETSAVLSWVLQEPEAAAIEQALAPARGFFTSELTQAECLRALRRLGTPIDGIAQARLGAFRLKWDTVPVESRLLASLGQQFPVEPLRTLDAIHMVTALDLRLALLDLIVASLDRQVRENAQALGFTVVP